MPPPMASRAIGHEVGAPRRNRWQQRRARAAKLAAALPYAGEILAAYARLLDVQEPAHARASADRPPVAELAAYAARNVGPPLAAAASCISEVLAEAADPWLRERAVDSIDCWLQGRSQPPADTFFARACSAPVLEALAPSSFPSTPPADAGHCPGCGGLPQFAFTADGEDALVTSPLRLGCARCGQSWAGARLCCAACGEADTSRLCSYAADEMLPHLRADACRSCRRYLLHVDLRRDREAVPEVDELAALPLDLHAQEQGFAKVIANVMGIG